MRLGKDTVVPLRLGVVNAYLIKGEGNVLVDAGPPGAKGAVLQACRGAGIPAEGIDLIVLTHAHSDHYGAAAEVQRKTGAPVVSHRLDAELAARGLEASLGDDLLGRALGGLGRFRTPPPAVESDLVFDDSFDLSSFGVLGRLLHTPGHTAGSLSVRLENGDALVGDLLMGLPPRPRRPREPFVAQDRVTLRSSLRALLDPPRPRRLLAGHGSPFEPRAVISALGL